MMIDRPNTTTEKYDDYLYHKRFLLDYDLKESCLVGRLLTK